MKNKFLISLGLAAVLTSGLASINEYREFKEVYAETYTASVSIADYASNNGWQNALNYNIVKLDDYVTVTTSGDNNEYSKYYTSGNAWRIYQTKSPKIEVSVAEGCELNSVKFTYKSDENGVITFGGNNISSGTYIEVSGMSATFGVGNTGTGTKGQARITDIEVSYTSNNTPVDKTNEVKDLFNTYYHDGNYTKVSVLNIDNEAIKDVAQYFHASADTKYRKTVYEGTEGKTTKLIMTTSEDGKDYNSNKSIYVNSKNGGVEHYTNDTYDYIVSGMQGNENRNSVDDWFVTLHDFKESSIEGWTKSGTVYSHDLIPATATEEDELTRMAREFVAPMWLAPNADNYAYARFDKLTVRVDTNDNLIMELHVKEDDYGITEDKSTLFSQITISRNHVWGNPTDLKNGTHQQTCTTNGCEEALLPVDHDFGSESKCECGAIKSSTISSKLDRAFTGRTGTSYSAWSGKEDSNGIVFAGNSAGGNDSIQLRSDKSNSGIVVTQNETGKKVAKITIEWQKNTTNGRTLNVYGKNNAYSQANDLYNNSSQGTKIGSIVKGTSTELEITGDYAYIGLRSNSGAMYITSITIEWK